MKKKTKRQAKTRKSRKKTSNGREFRLPVLLTILLLLLSVSRLVLPVFGKVTSYSILNTDGTILGVQNLSNEWDFSDPSEYKLYDDTTTEISTGVTKLIQFDQEDSDNTQAGFGSGTHSDTVWDTGNEWVELTSAGQTNGNGEFTSRTMDATSSTNWDTISWIPQRPSYKELPNYGQAETGYNSGNANMTGNALLMHMNETSGTVVDSSGQGNNGTYNGSSYSQSGKLNTAIGFDGNDYINCGDDNSLNIDGDITISSWAKLNSLGSYQGIYGGSNQTPDPRRGTTLAKWNDQRWVFFIGQNNSSYWTVFSNNTAVTGSWYHVVGVLNSGTMYIYINGVQQTNTQSGVTLYSLDRDTLIGRWYSNYNGYYFDGTIDEIAVWNRSLSATEILDIYKRGTLRLKYQVRSGTASPPTGDFIGPDGTTGDYYDELDNSTLTTPSFNLTNISDNQYFQYKTYFETDNPSYTPELKSVTIGPTHYTSSNPAVSNNTGITYSKLTSFTEVPGTGNQGSTGYQISNNNTDWYYWTGLKWEKETSAGHPSQTNTASIISANIGTFQESVGTGDFYFKAFLASDSTQQVEIDSIKLDYSTGSDDTKDSDDDNNNNPTGTYTPNASQDSDDDDDDIDTTPQTGEDQKFDIYMAIVDDDKNTIQLKGHAFDEIWIVAKVMGNTITAISADTKEWTMNISIENMQKYLKPGENIIEINAYDQNRNLLESRELILFKKVEYKISNYQTIIKTLDSAIISIGFIDITSGSILLIRKYGKTYNSSKRSTKKL